MSAFERFPGSSKTMIAKKPSSNPFVRLQRACGDFWLPRSRQSDRCSSPWILGMVLIPSWLWHSGMTIYFFNEEIYWPPIIIVTLTATSFYHLFSTMYGSPGVLTKKENWHPYARRLVNEADWEAARRKMTSTSTYKSSNRAAKKGRELKKPIFIREREKWEGIDGNPAFEQFEKEGVISTVSYLIDPKSPEWNPWALTEHAYLPRTHKDSAWNQWVDLRKAEEATASTTAGATSGALSRGTPAASSGQIPHPNRVIDENEIGEDESKRDPVNSAELAKWRPYTLQHPMGQKFQSHYRIPPSIVFCRMGTYCECRNYVWDEESQKALISYKRGPWPPTDLNNVIPREGGTYCVCCRPDLGDIADRPLESELTKIATQVDNGIQSKKLKGAIDYEQHWRLVQEKQFQILSKKNKPIADEKGHKIEEAPTGISDEVLDILANKPEEKDMPIETAQRHDAGMAEITSSSRSASHKGASAPNIPPAESAADSGTAAFVSGDVQLPSAVGEQQAQWLTETAAIEMEGAHNRIPPESIGGFERYGDVALIRTPSDSPPKPLLKNVSSNSPQVRNQGSKESVDSVDDLEIGNEGSVRQVTNRTVLGSNFATSSNMTPDNPFAKSNPISVVGHAPRALRYIPATSRTYGMDPNDKLYKGPKKKMQPKTPAQEAAAKKAKQLEDVCIPPQNAVICMQRGLEWIQIKYCCSCKLYRPPRASHCSYCQRCIERFDHHCPWVANCVGRNTFWHFVQFMWHMWTLTMFTIGLAIYFWLTASDNTEYNQKLRENNGITPSPDNADPVTFNEKWRWMWFDHPNTIAVIVYSIFMSTIPFSLACATGLMINNNRTTYEDLKGPGNIAITRAFNAACDFRRKFNWYHIYSLKTGGDNWKEFCCTMRRRGHIWSETRRNLA